MSIDSLLERLCVRGSTAAPPTTLLVAAHAADETIGAGALLSNLKQCCWIVHVTDGAPTDRRLFPEFATGWSRMAYARRRHEEAVCAAGLAGVDASRMSNMGVRDQESTFLMASITARVARLVLKLEPSVVLTHAYEGGHPDHDVVAFAVHTAIALIKPSLGSPPLIVEMTGYHDQSGTTVRGEFLPVRQSREVKIELTDDERKQKRAMFSAFASQREVLTAFRHEVERFRAAPSYDFNLPPHEGRLHYERFELGVAGSTWRAFARAATKKLNRKTCL